MVDAIIQEMFASCQKVRSKIGDMSCKTGTKVNGFCRLRDLLKFRSKGLSVYTYRCIKDHCGPYNGPTIPATTVEDLTNWCDSDSLAQIVSRVMKTVVPVNGEEHISSKELRMIAILGMRGFVDSQDREFMIARTSINLLSALCVAIQSLKPKH